MKLLYCFLATATILACVPLAAELVQVEETRWSDPEAQWGNQYRVTYTYDSVTGLKEGTYREVWLRGGEPDITKSQVDYLHGEKHGVEIIHDNFVYTPNAEKQIFWDHGVETGGWEKRFWGTEPDDPSRPMQNREWSWNGDSYHETDTIYHEENGAVEGHTESRSLVTGDLWVTLDSYSINYNLNGSKRKESWSKSFRKEDGTWQVRNIGPYQAEWREDGSPWFWRERDAKGELHGKSQEWTADGILRHALNYEHGLQDGTQSHYNLTTGALQNVSTMRLGVAHGPYRQYDPASGRLVTEGQFSNGSQCGLWTQYRVDGSTDVTDHGSCEPLLIVEDDPIFDEAAEADSVKWIEGRVFDKVRNLALGGIALEASGGFQAMTNAAGEFRMQLGGGDLYTLTIRAAGYQTRTGQLDMGNYQTRTLNIGLVPEGSDDKPRILGVESQSGDVFFEGLVANNKYTADIGWGEGTADRINFRLNGVDHAGMISGDQGTISLNMGAVLKPGLGSTTNTLNVIASNALGITSDPGILHPLLVPLPSWLTGLGALGAGTSEAGLINYKLSVQWPAEPFALELNPDNLGSFGWQAWSLMPLVGGQPFGLKSTQALLELELKTDGNGSALFGGQTGLRAGGQEITGTVGGRGHYYYRSGKGIEWKKGSLLVGIEGTIEKEAGIVDVIPALGNAVNLPVVGRAIGWINKQAKVNGVIGMGSDIELDIVDQSGALDFSQSEASLKASLQLGLSGGEGKLKLKFSGSGEARALFQIPANPDYLKRVEAELGAEIAVTAWLFQKSFSASHTFSYPTAAKATLAAAYPFPETLSFQPIPRDFADVTGYHRIAPASYQTLSSPDQTSWTTRISNVYPGTELHLLNEQSLHYIHFDPAKETLQATEWHEFSLYDRIDRARTDDQQADFNLSIGNVCAWMRVKDTAFPAAGPIEQMAAQIEIACGSASLSPGKTPFLVTDNDYLDLNPVVAGDYSQGYTVFWESNQGNQLVGSAEWPSRVHYAEWGGDTVGFSGIQTVPGTFVDASGFSYAVHGGEYMMAWIQDMDGDMATETDRELYTRQTVGGTWGAPLRITNNSTAPDNPRLLKTPAGEVALLWLEGGALYTTNVDVPGMHLLSAQTDDAIVSRFLSNVSLPNKPVILLIRLVGGDREASIIRWDATAGAWTGEIPLRLNLTDVELHDFAPQSYSDRSFLFAGLRSSESGVDIVTGTASSGLADLRLAFPDFFSLPEPVPGQPFAIPVEYVNGGYEALEGANIAVYGGPATPANRLGQVALPATLPPGGRGTAVVSFTAPLNGWSSELTVARARADGLALDAARAISLQVGAVDLEVLRISHNPNADGSATVRAVLRNTGPYAATNIPLELVSGSQTLGLRSLSGLYPGKSAEVDFQVWPDEDFLKAAPKLTVIIDPKAVLAETDRTNNRLDFQLRGDDGLWSLSRQIGPFRQVDWFGLLGETNSPWIHHFELGWLFVEAEDIGSLHIYDPELGTWIWTRCDLYPFIYHFGEQAWWVYDRGQAHPVSMGFR